MSACKSVLCKMCGSPAWTCDFEDCLDPEHKGSVELTGGGWACSEVCWEEAANAAEVETGGGSVNTYLVWDSEYPDEGAQEIEAESLDEALTIAAEQGDEDDHPSRYNGCGLTPELERKRRAMEGYRP